jgi:hypothetical protein
LHKSVISSSTLLLSSCQESFSFSNLGELKMEPLQSHSSSSNLQSFSSSSNHTNQLLPTIQIDACYLLVCWTVHKLHIGWRANPSFFPWWAESCSVSLQGVDSHGRPDRTDSFLLSIWLHMEQLASQRPCYI